MTDRAKILAEVACGVLEDAAFLFVEPVSPESTQPLELQATVAFKLPRAGWLRLATSRRLATAIAANMLGIEAGDPVALASAGEGLGELANVLAGALLARVFGTAQPMSIGVPAVGPAQILDEPAPCEVRASLGVEGGGAIALAFALEPGEGQPT